MNRDLKELVDVCKDPNTTYLNGSACKLENLPILFFRQFCENIEKSTSIATLDLSFNDIGGMEEVKLNALFNAIRKNKSIQTLKLISTKLNTLSKTNFAKLVKMFEENQSINEVRLDYNELDEHSTEFYKINLYVRRNEIQSELDTLEPVFKKNKTSPGFFAQKASSNGHLTNGNGHVAEETDYSAKIAELKLNLQTVRGKLFHLSYTIGPTFQAK